MEYLSKSREPSRAELKEEGGKFQKYFWQTDPNLDINTILGQDLYALKYYYEQRFSNSITFSRQK